MAPGLVRALGDACSQGKKVHRRCEFSVAIGRFYLMATIVTRSVRLRTEVQNAIG